MLRKHGGASRGKNACHFRGKIADTKVASKHLQNPRPRGPGNFCGAFRNNKHLSVLTDIAFHRFLYIIPEAAPQLETIKRVFRGGFAVKNCKILLGWRLLTPLWYLLLVQRLYVFYYLLEIQGNCLFHLDLQVKLHFAVGEKDFPREWGCDNSAMSVHHLSLLLQQVLPNSWSAEVVSVSPVPRSHPE